MAFFDEINKRINGLTQSAQKTADIARLQRQISLKQSDFDALFSEIGKLYYDCRQRGVQPGEAMEVLCGRLDALAAEIAGLKLKLDDLRDIRRCPKCASVQNNTNRFCANCGAQLEFSASDEEEAASAEAGQSPAEAAQEGSAQSGSETDGGVYINWPDAGRQPADQAERPARQEGKAQDE